MYKMVQQNVDWFGATCGQEAVTVTPPPPRDSQCISHTVPSKMVVGQTYAVTITYKNIGTDTWNEYAPGTNYFAATVQQTPESSPRLLGNGLLYNTTPITPGNNYTFAFQVTAPSIPGLYSGMYKMVQQNVDWFGAECGAPIVEVWPANESAVYPANPTTTSGSITWSAIGEVPDFQSQQKEISGDIKITKIEFNTQWTQGAHADLCLSMYRTTAPLYPSISGGYGELCLNTSQGGSTKSWSRTIDFSNNPLYIPANTKFSCGGSGGSIFANAGLRSCTVHYAPHTAGDQRFRLLRIPYLDAIFTPSQSFTPSWYHGTASQNLEVYGFQAFDAIDGASEICLRKINKATGAEISKECTTNNRSLTTDSEPAPLKMLSQPWTVSNSEFLTASCTASNASLPWDCALYVITKVPPAIPVSAANSFRDYGNVPHGTEATPQTIESWCKHYIEHTIQSGQAFQLCGFQSCTQAQQKLKCVEAFQAAS
jgi:uncharacterized protein affecting Mg2+/Co2+ transport